MFHFWTILEGDMNSMGGHGLSVLSIHTQFQKKPDTGNGIYLAWGLVYRLCCLLSKTTLDTDVDCSPQAEILGTAGLEDHWITPSAWSGPSLHYNSTTPGTSYMNVLMCQEADCFLYIVDNVFVYVVFFQLTIA